MNPRPLALYLPRFLDSIQVRGLPTRGAAPWLVRKYHAIRRGESAEAAVAWVTEHAVSEWRSVSMMHSPVPAPVRESAWPVVREVLG